MIRWTDNSGIGWNRPKSANLVYTIRNLLPSQPRLWLGSIWPCFSCMPTVPFSPYCIFHLCSHRSVSSTYSCYLLIHLVLTKFIILLQLAKKFHPDTNKDADAEKTFQEVNRAYEVLKDNDKREIYDQLGPEAYERQASGGDPGGPGFPRGNPFGDIFGDIFDNAYRGGQDVKVSVELSFMEAVQGCRKTITYEADTFCGTCNGSGVPPGTVPKTCKTCKGSGAIYMQKGIFTVECTCSLCNGSGKIVKTCKGEQVVKGKTSVKLDIAAGSDDNDIMKVFGKGGADVDRNKPGDLYVTIKVREDPTFRREGIHVHVDSVLSIAQAVLGGTVTVPTLTGNVTVKVRQGTQPGEKVVLRGKGIKARNSPVFGNQYVHFNIRVPTDVTQRQRELIDEFDKEECADRERPAVASG
uniref:Chaperone protein dnaJ GFA2 mitochondrial n=1 Tax=Zea mays TaxID=4577 RepID=A0A804REZ1_MAIZE